ncbi:MAG: energy transducer TonB [Hyphomicrobiales bacterium]|nr:energy transducer TonB [Hyphomicrobiales bacterium]
MHAVGAVRKMTAVQASSPPLEGVRFDLRDPVYLRSHRLDRLHLAAIFLVSLALHAGALLMPEQGSAPGEALEEAIPVEIVVEQPAPPVPEPQEPAVAQPPQQTLEEKPVSDFVRSTDQDREDGKDTPPPPEQKASKAEPEPDGLEPPGATAATPEKVMAAPEPPKAQHYALMPPLPDYEFKEPAKRSPDARGSADPGYLSTLYGRIMKQMQTPDAQPSSRRIHGRVVFGILSNGRIIQAAIAIPSGMPDLDAKALAAVRKGEPYPRPPNGGPVYIVFEYGAR